MTTSLTALCVLMMGGGLALSAEMPEMPKPTKEHEWLQRFVGEWTSESEIHMVPDEEPMKGSGTESVRPLGGFWIVSDVTGEMPGMTMKAVLTFGYDPKKEKYVGTWVDSMTSHMWEYEGTVDDSGKVLTLITNAFCPMEQRECEFLSTVEFVSDDERIFTEKKKSEDGEWVTIVKSVYKRKK